MMDHWYVDSTGKLCFASLVYITGFMGAKLASSEKEIHPCLKFIK
jgi:hypothetical protein